MEPKDVPALEGTELRRRNAPSLRVLVRLAQQCDSAEQLGKKLRRRYQRQYADATKTVTISPRVLPTATKVVPVYSHVMAHSAQHRDAAQTEPEPARMKDPVEQWLFDWEPDRLAHRVIEADSLSPGYARKVVDAIIRKMDTPPVMMH